MSQFMNVNLGMQNAWVSIPDEEKSAIWLPQFGWGYKNRGPQVISWQWEQAQRWPNSGFMSGDPSAPFATFGGDAREMDIYEPWSLGLGGKNRPYFIKGTVKDSIGNPVGGAVVQAFVTSTDAFVAEAVTDSNGRYSVPVPSTVAHYLVAYVTGSPDRAGSTVNTLVPAL